MTMNPDHFLFRATDTIGAIEAENDRAFLDECFVDTGVLEILKDCEDHRSILIGRTGAGKSALLARLANDCENSISINPHELALTHITNSGAVQFLADLNVNLSPFFKFLWRHVFAIQLVKLHRGLDEHAQGQDLASTIANALPKGKKHDKAVQYLREWGASFWLETDERVKEITQKLDSRASTSMGIDFTNTVKGNIERASDMSEERKTEVRRRGQEIINTAQVKDLSTIIKLLSDILGTNKQKKYHIVIDKLDENWVDTPLQMKLIRALIENSRDFQEVLNVKIIIALRSDLVDRVYRITRDEGFQEEKYKSCNLNLTWGRNDMINMLDKRIGVLVQRRYTTASVGYKDILDPDSKCMESVDSCSDSIDYMIQRTLNRPRDLISFFNTCIELSDGKPIIEYEAIVKAESIYSKDRLTALYDEWRGTYPSLDLLASLLRKKQAIVDFSSIPNSDIEGILVKVLQASSEGLRPLDSKIAEDYYDGNIDVTKASHQIYYVLYLTGLAGLKMSADGDVSWGYKPPGLLTEADVCDYGFLEVHPTFRKALAIC
jgi:hypothetical protein